MLLVAFSLSIAVLICCLDNHNSTPIFDGDDMKLHLFISCHLHFFPLWFAFMQQCTNTLNVLASVYRSRSVIFLCNFIRHLFCICSHKIKSRGASKNLWILMYSPSPLFGVRLSVVAIKPLLYKSKDIARLWLFK